MARSYRIALIPGDGIGVPVTEAAFAVAQKAAADVTLEGVTFPWSCDYYLKHGAMMPADGVETLRGFDAIYLGAVGWPAKVADSVSLHGLLLPIRKAFVQYANIRPHRLLAGVEGPLKTRDFDILCIRENTEGEYSGAGGRVHVGTPDEVAVETSVFTRTGVERILRFGFEQAMKRRRKLASVTKSNAQKYSMVFWDEITDRLAKEYPEVAASANINPGRTAPSMFEPVHGSAPDIAHLGIANPMAAIWSAAMMLDHLGEAAAAARILAAMEATTARGIGAVPGRDQTQAITDAVLAALDE
jgi:tartrate dehydrogenase/decarboxylase/D-malate dehydrogenase